MTSARRVWIVPCVLGALAGCAQPGPLFPQRTGVGSLKASVSHLEFENQQLRRKVAGLQKDNREIENRLVDEESVNGDLHARLDDARSLLGQRDPGASASASDPGPGAPGKTLPTGRSSRTGRKPPFAQIPGRIDAAPPAAEESDSLDDAPNAGSGWRGDLGPQSSVNDPTVWLPIARTGEPNPAPRR
jgi:hypothetical protein